MELETELPYLQQSPNFSFRKLYINCSPSFTIYLRSILILYTIYAQAFQSVFFCTGFPAKTLYSFLVSSYELQIPFHFIPFDSMTAMAIHGAPRFAVFSILLSLPLRSKYFPERTFLENIQPFLLP